MNAWRESMALRRRSSRLLGYAGPWLTAAMLVINIACIAAIVLCVHDPQRVALGATTLSMLLAILP